MSKHTKGPWKVGVKHEVKCDGFDGADTDTAYFIASEGYQDKSECEANARLIAVAPEMLETLKKGLKRLEELQKATGYPTAYVQILFMDVIKKAEGE